MFYRRHQGKRSRGLAAGFASLLLIVGCSAEPQVTDNRSDGSAEASFGINNDWSGDGLGLTASVAAFDIEVACDGGYTQEVRTTEFSLPIRNTNCVAKLRSFEREGNRHYEPKTGQGFTSYAPADRAVFSCVSGAGCYGSPDLTVYVMKQLPAPTLTVFAEVRYKFAENTLGADVTIQQTDLNFSKVVVGDEPPPFTLRAALEGAQEGRLELLAECNEFQIGGTLADGICATTSMDSMRVALAPWPEGDITLATLEDLMGTHSQLLAANNEAIFVEQGVFGLGRGGFSVPLAAADADTYIFAMTTSGSDSYTYHKVVRATEETFTVGGQIAGLETGDTLGLALNGQVEQFTANGSYSHAKRLNDLASYSVEVASAPAGKVCAVAGGEGTVSSANVGDVKVTCAADDSASRMIDEKIQLEFMTAECSESDCAESSGYRDVVILLDSTTSVNDTNWNSLAASISTIAQNIASVNSDAVNYAVMEFGNTQDKTLAEALAQNRLHFLAGSMEGMTNDPAAAAGIVATSDRKVREAIYDGVGPAIIRAQEYLEAVGREGAAKEIWIVHDMACCGFPGDGETGSQIDDASYVKELGTTVIGIRTLRSIAIGDELASPDLAFSVGDDIAAIADLVAETVAPAVEQTYIAKRSYELSATLDPSALDKANLRIQGLLISKDLWSLDADTNMLQLSESLELRLTDEVIVHYQAAD
jgi:hypothetical protein